jgi:hypothetical protein
MAAMMLLGFVLCAGAAVMTVLLVVGIALKLVLRLILLPLLLLKWLIGGLVLLVVGPIFAIVGLFALFVLGAVLALPLLPFVLLGLLIWVLARSSRPAIVRA